MFASSQAVEADATEFDPEVVDLNRV